RGRGSNAPQSPGSGRPARARGGRARGAPRTGARASRLIDASAASDQSRVWMGDLGGAARAEPHGRRHAMPVGALLGGWLLLSAAPGPGTVTARDMVAVPAGWFLSGSDDRDADPDERPRHRASTRAFEIDRTEVTRAAYARCVAPPACHPPTPHPHHTPPPLPTPT